MNLRRLTQSPATRFQRWATLAVLLLASSALPQETQRQFLSGQGKDDTVPWKFFCTEGPQSGYWTNLPVPSNWELFGFGTLHYQTEPTNMFAEQGRYQCDFTVPPDWAQRRVFLVFDGVMTDTHAEINGQSAGNEHQGSFYRFKYEVSRLLKVDATNRLDVLVHKRSANASVNRAERQGDYWLFGGIFRPVYLEAMPSNFIERVAIDARADGNLRLDVFANSLAPGAPPMQVEAQISTPDGQAVGPAFSGELADAKATLQTRATSPRQWTAETPHLYRVEVRLKQGEQVLHRVEQRFGFRTMEVREGDGLYVNGRRVVLKGADRHSAWPVSGRCLSEAVHRKDIQTMKDMNMNAVRMSHYPPDEQFLDLCDELGLYVLDELAGWHWNYDTPTGRKLVEEMITRDVNHPSILFWDNGNEGGWNTELDPEFARWDPQQRRVLHPWTTLNGVNTSHYLTYDRAKAACEGTPMFHDRAERATGTNGKAIYMPTEFLHGLYDGGVGAGLEDYWELMRNSKYLGGGFIWALLDEGIKRPDTRRIDVAGNRAPDGIVGPYREKEASFYTIKEIWSPLTASFIGLHGTGSRTAIVHLQNRYSFTDTRACRMSWQVRRFRGPEATAAGSWPLAGGMLQPPSIGPGEEGSLSFDLPASLDLQQADALAVRIDDPTGRELWTWVWPLAAGNEFRKLLQMPTVGTATTSETADLLEVKAEDLTVRISKQSGMLAGVTRNAPSPERKAGSANRSAAVFRDNPSSPPSSNAWPQTFSLTNGPRPAVGSATLTSLEKSFEGPDCIVTAKFEGNLQSVTWRVRGNGWIRCEYTYVATGPRDYYGVMFDYPESLVKKKKWLGDGPYRVWKNRRRGVTLDVWENDYNNTVTGWRDWAYPEFKGCFANVHWLQLETAEGQFTVVPERNDQFIQVLTPEFPPAELQAKTAVSLPTAGLALLDAIPPIGSKFHSARDTGPQGQANVAQGAYSNSFNVYFGTLDSY